MFITDYTNSAAFGGGYGGGAGPGLQNIPLVDALQSIVDISSGKKTMTPISDAMAKDDPNWWWQNYAERLRSPHDPRVWQDTPDGGPAKTYHEQMIERFGPRDR